MVCLLCFLCFVLGLFVLFLVLVCLCLMAGMLCGCIVVRCLQRLFILLFCLWYWIAVVLTYCLNFGCVVGFLLFSLLDWLDFIWFVLFCGLCLDCFLFWFSSSLVIVCFACFAFCFLFVVYLAWLGCCLIWLYRAFNLC